MNGNIKIQAEYTSLNTLIFSVLTNVTEQCTNNSGNSNTKRQHKMWTKKLNVQQI